jgi:hypothetical protein
VLHALDLQAAHQEMSRVHRIHRTRCLSVPEPASPLPPCGSGGFEHHGDALADPNAHGGQPVAAATAVQLPGQ